MSASTVVRAPWLRVSPPVRSFILGEVERQYHPIGTQEYAERVEWMTDAWMWARRQSSEPGHRVPTVDDVLHLAGMIEPEKNAEGFRTVRGFVGDHEGTAPQDVLAAVERLWTYILDVTPVHGRGRFDRPATADDFYLEFQGIHPFRDGNGRTGKIIHNWILGTGTESGGLFEPALIADYFGGGNP